MIDLLAARLRTAARDPRGALQQLRVSASRYRDYRPVQYAYVEALQAVGAHDEALAELSDAIQRRPADPRLHAMQARSHAGKGRSLLQHRALAEQYYHMGSLSAAIEQLQLAQRSKDGDFYQMSAVDARLRELRAEMAERARK